MDIKGLEVWEEETKEWNREAGAMKMQAGAGLIDALEAWYGACQTKLTDRNKRECMLWRLRLHLKFPDDEEFLEKLDETFNIGLRDETIGKTFFDCELPTETSGAFTTGFNWRRDSGEAIRGRSSRRKHDKSVDKS